MKQRTQTKSNAIQPNTIKGLMWSLVATVLLSAGLIAAKYAMQEHGDAAFNAVTFTVIWTAASAFFATVIVVAGGQMRQLAIRRSSRKNILLLGVATAFGMILGWSGLERLDPSLSAFFFRFSPVLTLLLSAIVLKEKLLRRELLPIAVMILGGFVSAVGRWEAIGAGAILVLLASVAFAVQLLLGKIEAKTVPAAVLVFYRSTLACIGLTIWGLATGALAFDVASKYYLVAIFGALLAPCLGLLATFQSYKYWGLSRYSIVFTVQPVFVLVMSYAILRQLPTQQGLIGGCIIMSGAFALGWIHLPKGPQSRRPRQAETPNADAR